MFEKLYRLSKTASFDLKTTEAQHYRRYLLQQRVVERKAGVTHGGGAIAGIGFDWPCSSRSERRQRVRFHFAHGRSLPEWIPSEVRRQYSPADSRDHLSRVTGIPELTGYFDARRKMWRLRVQGNLRRVALASVRAYRRSAGGRTLLFLCPEGICETFGADCQSTSAPCVVLNSPDPRRSGLEAAFKICLSK